MSILGNKRINKNYIGSFKIDDIFLKQIVTICNQVDDENRQKALKYEKENKIVIKERLEEVIGQVIFEIKTIGGLTFTLEGIESFKENINDKLKSVRIYNGDVFYGGFFSIIIYADGNIRTEVSGEDKFINNIIVLRDNLIKHSRNWYSVFYSSNIFRLIYEIAFFVAIIVAIFFAIKFSILTFLVEKGGKYYFNGKIENVSYLLSLIVSVLIFPILYFLNKIIKWSFPKVIFDFGIEAKHHQFVLVMQGVLLTILTVIVLPIVLHALHLT